MSFGSPNVKICFPHTCLYLTLLCKQKFMISSQNLVSLSFLYSSWASKYLFFDYWKKTFTWTFCTFSLTNDLGAHHHFIPEIKHCLKGSFLATSALFYVSLLMKVYPFCKRSLTIKLFLPIYQHLSLPCVPLFLKVSSHNWIAVQRILFWQAMAQTSIKISACISQYSELNGLKGRGLQQYIWKFKVLDFGHCIYRWNGNTIQPEDHPLKSILCQLKCLVFIKPPWQVLYFICHVYKPWQPKHNYE